MSLASRAVGLLAARARRWPLAKASAYGRRLGLLAYRLDARHRRVALRNLAQAFPERSPAWHRQIARASFQQAGRTVVEMLWSARLDEMRANQVVQIRGSEHLEQALGAGKGVLLATAHFGNWEILGVTLALQGVPLVSIARPLDDEDLDRLLIHLRTRTGAGILPKKNALRPTLRALRSNHAVAVMSDQNTLRQEAVFVPFFGKLAATTPAIALLHLRTEAPILPALTFPHGAGYALHIEPPVRIAVGNGQDATTAITAELTARLEAQIREHPQAWLWMHDRWRERPLPGPAARDNDQETDRCVDTG